MMLINTESPREPISNPISTKHTIKLNQQSKNELLNLPRAANDDSFFYTVNNSHTVSNNTLENVKHAKVPRRKKSIESNDDYF